MPRLSKQKIRRLVMQELARVVGEDALVNRVKDMNRDTGYDDIQRVKGANAGMHASCSQCGSTEVYEGECMECGATGSRMLEGKMCEQCGSSDMYEGECMECGYSKGGMLEEGGCGCGTCSTCSDNDMDDDFIPDQFEQPAMFSDSDYMSHDHDGGDDITQIIMGALGGMKMDDDVHMHKDPGMPAGYVPSHNNYMAKPSLYKVAKYAQKLLQMIPDGYELDDWQRTKIAQISDDISEVYHSLDYDFHDDEF
jgi:hypothetical protein